MGGDVHAASVDALGRFLPDAPVTRRIIGLRPTRVRPRLAGSRPTSECAGFSRFSLGAAPASRGRGEPSVQGLHAPGDRRFFRQ